MIEPSTNGNFDLSTLSLDAAMELDLLERQQPASLDAVRKFLDHLAMLQSPMNEPGALGLSDPIGVQLFRSALARMDADNDTSVNDLETRLNSLVNGFDQISKDENARPVQAISLLKRFCLSLHEAFLNESSPFRHSDDFETGKDELFA